MERPIVCGVRRADIRLAMRLRVRCVHQAVTVQRKEAVNVWLARLGNLHLRVGHHAATLVQVGVLLQ